MGMEIFANVRYVRWTQDKPENVLVATYNKNEIYPLLRIEGDDMVIEDPSGEQIYVEPEDVEWFAPVSDNEFKDSRKKNKPQQQAFHNPNRPQIEAESNAFSITVDLNENQFPYWTQYVCINGEGVWALTNPPEEVSTMKERVTLENPIVIKIPQKKKPFEILANLFKEGKITYEELEAELKSIL